MGGVDWRGNRIFCGPVVTESDNEQTHHCSRGCRWTCVYDASIDTSGCFLLNIGIDMGIHVRIYAANKHISARRMSKPASYA